MIAMMTEVSETETPETLIPELVPYWQFWNLGNHPYFRQGRQRETAKLTYWIHTREDADRDQLRSQVDPDSTGRWTPAGRYAKLSVKIDPVAETDSGWRVMMSDTPDEMNDHIGPIMRAKGRVLIHGLGLGCILNVIAHKEEVTHIDVVELDPNIIEMIMPFYTQHVSYEVRRKINFHAGSCVDHKWPPGTRWNYVWHDIWRTISPDNLTQKNEPENGISYELMHRKFGGRCDEQGSWAFEMARWMRKVEIIADQILFGWQCEYNVSNPEKRYEMLVSATNSVLTPIDTWKMLLRSETMKKYNDQLLDQAKREMDEGEVNFLLSEKAKREAQRMVKR